MAQVLVAMSGGVDSAVAAALLVEQGHDVTGVHLKLADIALEEQVPGHGCCTLDDAQDARRAAQVLGIPFYVWDLSELFRREVQDPFARAYAGGVTPNPCVTCNERVKYAGLLQKSASMGFDALATGHHARLRRNGAVVRTPGPATRLHRAADRRKDQSYVLYVATPEQLDRTLLPVGEIEKDEVRRLAHLHGLRVADKPDSYDVCFIPDGDTTRYLGQHLPARPGPVVDLDGRRVGEHEGVWRYTVGQRRGLNLGTHERRFVVDVDAASATVRVGPREALACSWAEVGAPTWTTGDVPSGDVRVQIRAHGATVPGRVETGGDDAVRLHLDEPVHGLAIGQAAVVYDAADEVCLGGGRVTRAERPAGLPVV
ncbi:tRNA 2-thiouridine(34) synthase MnmA [Egicoccus sp. AB-alg6-2]|uniref:tRNA 2-thiouridine(34) synthase MnmA n=1 Tax=Egicoccus sp. AB-alg6-2 TaxID=3242692 RepID=UPI00359EA017